MSFFAEMLITIMALFIIVIIIFISCKIIDLFWMIIYACFKPLLCPNRHREPWPIEICNCIIVLFVCIEKTFGRCCSICCSNINKKLRRCRIRLKLCKIQASKKFDKIRVKPIVYDDVHIIVINPYDNYQIATVAKIINEHQ